MGIANPASDMLATEALSNSDGTTNLSMKGANPDKNLQSKRNY